MRRMKMTDQVISEYALTDEHKEFLDGITERTEQLVEEIARYLIDVEERTDCTCALERDFEVDGRTVRFSVELLPDLGDDLGVLLASILDTLSDDAEDEQEQG